MASNQDRLPEMVRPLFEKNYTLTAIKRPPRMELIFSCPDEMETDFIPEVDHHKFGGLTEGWFHRTPWPKIPNLSTYRHSLADLVEENPQACIMEKLDGANLSLTSDGLIFSRRVLSLNNPSQRELRTKKFANVSLGMLEAPRNYVKALKDELDDILDRNTTVTVYGELMLPGTGGGREDKFGYQQRGYEPGQFVAFGLGIWCLGEEDAMDKLREKGFEHVTYMDYKEKPFRENHILVGMCEELQDLLYDFGFLVPQTCYLPLKEKGRRRRVISRPEQARQARHNS